MLNPESLIEENSVASEIELNEQNSESAESTVSDWDDDVTRFEEATTNFILTGNEFVYFDKLFDDSMMEQICFQTNLYANQKNSAQWKELTVQELKLFWAL